MWVGRWEHEGGGVGGGWGGVHQEGGLASHPAGAPGAASASPGPGGGGGGGGGVGLEGGVDGGLAHRRDALRVPAPPAPPAPPLAVENLRRGARARAGARADGVRAGCVRSPF